MPTQRTPPIELPPVDSQGTADSHPRAAVYRKGSPRSSSTAPRVESHWSVQKPSPNRSAPTSRMCLILFPAFSSNHAREALHEESQFSIRGSGLRNNFHIRGINILQDGFILNNADGFFWTGGVWNLRQPDASKSSKAPTASFWQQHPRRRDQFGDDKPATSHVPSTFGVKAARLAFLRITSRADTFWTVRPLRRLHLYPRRRLSRS